MPEVEISTKRPPEAEEPERDLLAEAVALAAEELPPDPGPPVVDKVAAFAARLGIEPCGEDEPTISLRAAGTGDYYALIDILDAFLDRIESAALDD